MSSKKSGPSSKTDDGTPVSFLGKYNGDPNGPSSLKPDTSSNTVSLKRSPTTGVSSLSPSSATGDAFVAKVKAKAAEVAGRRRKTRKLKKSSRRKSRHHKRR